ncbi:MAG TPA: FtsW/RodA/SpoVE family cell cycle protein [Candidatus Syntrophosphaera sp.]|jgi:rod shape determining protein RodA|nr:FtsW/RodA/SpoVE family cell cycle protein [Candidatus Cloacimonadota bacterium]OQB92491.1 MAG: Rod shape-determining protein RodA [Candidatus Cloacimonetes bacterium ADurb.Bin117]HNU53717.1 FtsW/RodA/SpoVE family cell cycle protein [Candidatus Syntrophosphaera sp.]MDI9524369.1 FtsW/RodA/SpoVE family cell cycle protein [Candidatus Cloacimonadota bacterium]NLH92800.1 rod shape-determining protein RodA [Candidatus Cloacimonadota bacterium]
MIRRKKFDFTLAGFLVLLIFIGCVSIFTASTTTIGEYTTTQSYWWKQLIFAGISLGMIWLLIRLPMPILDLIIIPAYVLNLLALIAVLFTPAVNGAHRWFSFLGLNYQPSESAKLLTILVVARAISRDNLTEIKQILYGLGLTLMPVLLILIEPDFGTTLVFFFSLLAMLVAAEVPLVYLLLLISPVVSMLSSLWLPAIFIWIAILVVLLLWARLSWVTITIAGILNGFLALIMPMFWNGLKDYQQSRIVSFFNPMADPLGAGYQIIQAKIAIGSGSILGKGWLMGTQKNMNFLPEHHTDFIFSVIGEEFGFIGAFLLLGVFFFFFWRLITDIGEIKVRERKIASAGIFAFLMFQTFINIGMNIGLVPATGIPLPFVSYGGSNLLFNSLAVGVILKYLNERGLMK